MGGTEKVALEAAMYLKSLRKPVLLLLAREIGLDLPDSTIRTHLIEAILALERDKDELSVCVEEIREREEAAEAEAEVKREAAEAEAEAEAEAKREAAEAEAEAKRKAAKAEAEAEKQRATAYCVEASLSNLHEWCDTKRGILIDNADGSSRCP
ncbi:hypothetical protein MTO96_028134 [Rhipicephalus appendiculatus]